jgi:hypothetical protein
VLIICVFLLSFLLGEPDSKSYFFKSSSVCDRSSLANSVAEREGCLCPAEKHEESCPCLKPMASLLAALEANLGVYRASGAIGGYAASRSSWSSWSVSGGGHSARMACGAVAV